MPKWEVCKIVTKQRYQGFSIFEKEFRTYLAVVDTTDGQRIIDQTPEVPVPAAGEKRPKTEEERAKLVGRLLANGWEPMQAEYNEVSVFRRQIP